MKSFGITVAFVLAVISTNVGALPAGQTLARRDEEFRFPVYRPKPAVHASGSNGASTSCGVGAIGGSIDVSSREDDTEKAEEFWVPYHYYHPAHGSITASGGNGGENWFGNGANGGDISISRREDDWYYPIWLRPYPVRNAAKTASVANGGENWFGDGANGADISISRREEDWFYPIWRPAYANHGPKTAVGANGGWNYGGNGANGGDISIN